VIRSKKDWQDAEAQMIGAKKNLAGRRGSGDQAGIDASV
jgi:hypothetical protein